MNYRNLTFIEKVQADEALIQRCVDYELASKGLLKPEPPVNQETVPLKLPKKDRFLRLMVAGCETPVLFDPKDVARVQAILDLAVGRVEHCYDAGYNDDAKGYHDDARATLETADLLPYDTLKANARAMKQNRDAVEQDNKATAQYRKELAALEDGVSEVRDAFSQARADFRNLERVARKMDEYAVIAGPEGLGVALRFLLKAFDPETVNRAIELVLADHLRVLCPGWVDFTPAQVEEAHRLLAGEVVA